MTEPYELPLWPCSSNIPATFISHLGITYHEMFTGAYRCFRCLNMNDPMYHSQCKHLARMGMVQGGLACSNFCLRTEASVNILWNGIMLQNFQFYPALQT